MEIALLFLAKAIAGGVVGHYLKKLLEKIDKHLVVLFEGGESIEKIGAYVREAGLEEKVTAMVGKAINESVVVPIGVGDIPTVDEKCQLFVDILNVGYEISMNLKVDLLLPGSFVGSDTYSLFVTSNTKSYTVSVEELAIQPLGRTLFVFPGSQSFLSRYNAWQQYKEAVRIARQSTKDHLTVSSTFDFLTPLIEDYDVEVLTPGVIKYQYARIMPKKKQKAIGAENGVVELHHWAEGMSLMVNALHEIKDLQILDPKELEDIVRLQTRLRDLTSFA